MTDKEAQEYIASLPTHCRYYALQLWEWVVGRSKRCPHQTSGKYGLSWTEAQDILNHMYERGGGS